MPTRMHQRRATGVSGAAGAGRRDGDGEAKLTRDLNVREVC